MIRLGDTLLLASTKLKVRKIRLIVTLIIASLLFSALFFIAFVSSGIIRSLDSFGKEGYGGRYIVEVSLRSYDSFHLQFDPEFMNELTAKQNEMIALKKSVAKKLGLSYTDTDAANDATLPIIPLFPGAPADAPRTPNIDHPYVLEKYRAKNNVIQGISFDDFTNYAKANGAHATYQGLYGNNVTSGLGRNASASIQVMIDGKEDLKLNDSSAASFSNGPPTGIQTITYGNWSQKQSSLLTPFLLPNQHTALGTDGSVPIIAPNSAAEEILGLKALPATATLEEKLSRQVELRQKIAGKTAQICYRSVTSATLLQKAVAQQKEIASNKNNKDYVKPSLLYRLPTKACGPTTIEKDTRNAEEKKLQASQDAFDQQFDPQPPAIEGVLTVRIVGLSADLEVNNSISALSILNGLLRSSLGNGWFTPSEAVTQSPLATTILGDLNTAEPNTRAFYAEFANADLMKSFIKKTTCEAEQAAGMNFTSPQASLKVQQTCINDGKLYFVNPYGNSAAAVDDFKHKIAKFSRYIIAAVVIIASVILMGTIGKIIADSRRETAVFRALGAKRFDIAQIYLTYSLLVGCIIVVLSLMVGGIAAYIFNQIYSPAMSIFAVLSYGAVDVNKQFVLFGIDAIYLWLIAALIMASALISALVPILTNISRNPIRDMRDDS